jgi:LacI family transcriptional regulator, galactose operon repressor
MPPKITIYDIARAAGVGIGTVSRVLNSHPNVTPETRERVREVVKRLHYQPHAYAQRLARNQSETISAIIPFFTNYFFVEVLRGVQEYVGRLGYDLTLFGVNDVNQVESKIGRALQRGRVDGILFFSMKLPDKVVPRLKEAGIPIVLVDSYHPGFDSISIANEDGAYQASTYLIKLGHRNIGMINALQISLPARERLQGYRRALESNGLRFSENLVKTGINTKADGFNREAGYEAMMEFIKMGEQMPRAYFVSSDIQSIGAIAALTDNGFKVPEDVSIVGFDDIELASHMNLTTMRQPMFQMGHMAVERLAARMSNQNLKVIHTTFLPELVVRGTSLPADGRKPG